MSNKRKVAIAAGAAAIVVVLWLGFCLWRAGRAGQRVRSALVAAETSLQAHDVATTRRHLAEASSALDAMNDNLGRLGPMRTVARVTPVVRIQLRGIEAFVDAGRQLTNSAASLTDAMDGVLHPADPNASIATTLEPLRHFDATLQDGIRALNRANDKIATLNGNRLLGPLDGARRELTQRLATAQQKATDGEQSVRALLTAMGGDGPRRYLVLAQNPDEVRPTGGFIGSYGLLEADGANVKLDRFAGIETWTHPRPDVVVPDDQQAAAFRVLSSGGGQRLSNVNASIDFPADAELARQLWVQGGEQPVDGVLLITPDLLVRMLQVLGPVQVPEYDETVTAANLIDRLNYYTHLVGYDDPTPGGRKEFLSALAEPILHNMLHAPSSKWIDLGEALAAGFDQGEAMASSPDTNAQAVLAREGWDGRLPDVGGDFFADGDFEYAAKNGRGLQRTFEHVVQIQPDGSADVETTMTVADTLPLEPDHKTNVEAPIYTALYGPTGATLAPGADEPFVDDEDAVAGHPAVGYDLHAPPLGSAQVTVRWHVPTLLQRGTDDRWHYTLFWRHVIANRADTVHLDVRLPNGWKWHRDAPRSDVRLDGDFSGDWAIDSP